MPYIGGNFQDHQAPTPQISQIVNSVIRIKMADEMSVLLKTKQFFENSWRLDLITKNSVMQYVRFQDFLEQAICLKLVINI